MTKSHRYIAFPEHHFIEFQFMLVICQESGREKEVSALIQLKKQRKRGVGKNRTPYLTWKTKAILKEVFPHMHVCACQQKHICELQLPGIELTTCITVL